MCEIYAHEKSGQPGNDDHTFLSIKSFEPVECLNRGKDSLMLSSTHFFKNEMEAQK